MGGGYRRYADNWMSEVRSCMITANKAAFMKLPGAFQVQPEKYFNLKQKFLFGLQNSQTKQQLQKMHFEKRVLQSLYKRRIQRGLRQW